MMNLNYKVLLILSGFTFAQIQAMESDHLSKLMPQITLSEDAETLINLSGNSTYFRCMYRPHNPKLSPRTNERIQILNDLLDKDGNPYNELKPEDLQKVAQDSTILQAWLYLLRGDKRDTVIEQCFMAMLKKRNYFYIGWFIENNLQVDKFDPGFLETLAKIAELKKQYNTRENFLALINSKDGKK